jgi:type II restriction/modification system DNA methylase subunit YeeA
MCSKTQGDRHANIYIKSEYEKSLSKLLPLKEKLRKTDWLIDQIVYKLYGLTEEEIKIVECKNNRCL